MEMVILEVCKQEMWRKNEPVLVADEVNFVQLKVAFDESWTGLNKSYQFKNGLSTYQIESNDETITIPHEVMTVGTLEIMIKGTKLDENSQIIDTKATVTPATIEIQESGLVDNPNNTGEATPTVIEQIREIAENAENIAESVREDADEGEFTPHFNIGSVESIEGSPEVNMTGTELDPVLNFKLPKGDKGDVNFFIFDIDVDTGQLIMYKTEQYTGNISFELDSDGCLIEEMEVA